MTDHNNRPDVVVSPNIQRSMSNTGSNSQSSQPPQHHHREVPEIYRTSGRHNKYTAI